MKKAEERKQQAQGPARQAIEFFELKNKHTRISNKLLTLKKYVVKSNVRMCVCVQVCGRRRSHGGDGAS
jgi:hypothetical protein